MTCSVFEWYQCGLLHISYFHRPGQYNNQHVSMHIVSLLWSLLILSGYGKWIVFTVYCTLLIFRLLEGLLQHQSSNTHSHRQSHVNGRVQSASCSDIHMPSNLGFSILPKDTSTNRPEEQTINRLISWWLAELKLPFRVSWYHVCACRYSVLKIKNETGYACFCTNWDTVVI